MIKNYQEFLNEHIMKHDILNSVPLLVSEFIKMMDLEPGVAFLDVWCTFTFEDFNAVFDNNNISSVFKVEQDEREQRALPFRKRHVSDYYVLEFSLWERGTTWFRQVGIDTKNKKFYTEKHAQESFKAKVEKVSEQVLKEHFPTVWKSQRYGL